jgi:hypothetical protein
MAGGEAAARLAFPSFFVYRSVIWTNRRPTFDWDLTITAAKNKYGI